MHSEISRRASLAFHSDALAAPQMTLRGGYAEDSYDFALPPDPVLDELTDTYLVAFSEDSANSDFAKQVLEEWWIPDALYRKHLPALNRSATKSSVSRLALHSRSQHRD